MPYKNWRTWLAAALLVAALNIIGRMDELGRFATYYRYAAIVLAAIAGGLFARAPRWKMPNRFSGRLVK